MSKNIDPVSGNKIPFGASAKEVRDDIPIMASENEYVIPANVVRFLGLEKIEKMVGKAKEALAEMGSLMGEDDSDGMVEDEELPFDPNELEGVPHLAEGGEVAASGFKFPQDNGYTGVKEFKNKDGSVMYVPFVNGAPLYSVPDGFTESAAPSKGDDPESTPNKAAAQVQQPLPLMDNSAKENGKFVEQNKSPLAGDPKNWKVEDFINFGRNRDSLGNKAIKGMISMMPAGKLAVKAREAWLDSAVNKQFDAMLETGLDPMGNPITPDQKNLLMSTRENLKKDMSKETGLSFSPLETLAGAVQRFTSFTGEGITTPQSSLSNRGTNMVNSYSKPGDTYSGGNQKLGSNLGNGSDSQYSGSTYGGAGNKDGSASKSAVDNAKSGSGGLYAEGGLVNRRNKK